MAAAVQADCDGAVCDLCAEVADSSLDHCCICSCPGCGKRIYHRDCLTTFLRRIAWRGDMNTAGLGAFTCPRGHGKVQNGGVPCKCRIDIVVNIPLKTAKSELKKAARIAAAAQQAAARRTTAHHPPRQQQPQQQAGSVRMPKYPQASHGALYVPAGVRVTGQPAPGVGAPKPVAAAMVGPERREVPGMEYDEGGANKGKGARRTRKHPAGGAVAGGVPAVENGDTAPPVPPDGRNGNNKQLIGHADALPSGNWVSNIDSYNKILASLGVGDDPYEQHHEDGGEWAAERQASFTVSETVTDLALEDSGCWEAEGTDPMQAIADILAALGFPLPLEPPESPQRALCLRQFLDAFAELAQQGYDMSELTEVVNTQVQQEAGASGRSSSGGAVLEPWQQQQPDPGVGVTASAPAMAPLPVPMSAAVGSAVASPQFYHTLRGASWASEPVGMTATAAAVGAGAGYAPQQASWVAPAAAVAQPPHQPSMLQQQQAPAGRPLPVPMPMPMPFTDGSARGLTTGGVAAAAATAAPQSLGASGEADEDDEEDLAELLSLCLKR